MSQPVANLAYVPIGFGIPQANDARSGAKLVSSGPLQWPQPGGGYLLDMSQNLQLQELQNIQSVWVDNSQAAKAVNILVSGTNQSITVPANAQAWLPVFATERSTFTITSAAASGSSVIQLLNIPCSTYVFVPGP